MRRAGRRNNTAAQFHLEMPGRAARRSGRAPAPAGRRRSRPPFSQVLRQAMPCCARRSRAELAVGTIERPLGGVNDLVAFAAVPGGRHGRTRAGALLMRRWRSAARGTPTARLRRIAAASGRRSAPGRSVLRRSGGAGIRAWRRSSAGVGQAHAHERRIGQVAHAHGAVEDSRRACRSPVAEG